MAPQYAVRLTPAAWGSTTVWSGMRHDCSAAGSLADPRQQASNGSPIGFAANAGPRMKSFAASASEEGRASTSRWSAQKGVQGWEPCTPSRLPNPSAQRGGIADPAITD